MLSDIEIASSCQIKKITSIAKKIKLKKRDYVCYGEEKAKINYENIKVKKQGNLILVTSINPTSAGEGKTTTSIGLVDSLNKIGKKTILCLREPSLGPCFGIKGGACGGGYSQVIPMADINLHFTGDIHALTVANNLIAACLDNHLYFGNELKIDPKTICFNRVLDLNDRALRKVTTNYDSDLNRNTSFDITVASELMAILCLARDLMDLKKRIDNITIGYTKSKKRITVKDLKISGSITLLLKDAIKPNLVQTLEHNPVLIHGGPFANIAHGCNSLIATKTALNLSDYVVTEAGFGADLGAEKFFDIKCRIGNLKPNLVVLVATIRALKLHGGINVQELNKENIKALEKGFCNLQKHYQNLKKYKIPIVIALNKFPSDYQSEIDFLIKKCQDLNMEIELNDTFSQGSKVGINLAKAVIKKITKSSFKPLYTNSLPLDKKIDKIAKEIYGAKEVIYSEEAKKELNQLAKMGFNEYPVCIAKTQYSFSDEKNLIGCPQGFMITINQIKLSSGAGFVVALTKNIMTMPGLPKVPLAEKIDIDKNNKISGLF